MRFVGSTPSIVIISCVEKGLKVHLQYQVVSSEGMTQEINADKTYSSVVELA